MFVLHLKYFFHFRLFSKQLNYQDSLVAPQILTKFRQYDNHVYNILELNKSFANFLWYAEDTPRPIRL